MWEQFCENTLCVLRVEQHRKDNYKEPDHDYPEYNIFPRFLCHGAPTLNSDEISNDSLGVLLNHPRAHFSLSFELRRFQQTVSETRQFPTLQ